MTTTNEHPWQSGPRELFQFAMNALKSTEEVNRRIGFLLVDVCVETTFRTFLGLPTRLSGSKVGHSDLRRYAAGNFHDLADGVGLAAAGKITDDALHYARFYHGIRNRLYHEGNGITVREEYVQGYAALAANFLKQLIGIDAEGMLPAVWKQGHVASSVALKQLCKELSKDIDRFEHLVSLAMEHSEPRMIYPSTIHKLKDISQFDVATFPGKLQAFRDLIEANISNDKLRSWLLNFLADDVSYDRPQIISNSQFIMELGQDPVSFYAFLIGIQSLPLEDVSMETLDNWDDISFIRQDDYSIMGIYESAKFFLQMLDGKYWFGMSEAELLERCKELQGMLKSTATKLEGLPLPN